MTNVEKATDDFYERICERIDAIYDPSKCKTREDLVRLIDGEIIELMKLQQFTNDGLRDACYEGLQKDGIEFPKILWAKYVGTGIKVPYYNSIREEVPQEQPISSKPPLTEHGTMKREAAGKTNTSKGPHPVAIVVGAGVVTGTTLNVTGIAKASIPLISKALITLGIYITAAGVLTFVGVVATREKSTQQTRSEARQAVAPDVSAQQSKKKEEEYVANILHEQRRRCKKYAEEWCKDVLDIVQAGVEQARMEE